MSARKKSFQARRFSLPHDFFSSVTDEEPCLLTASKTTEHPFLELRNELKAFNEGLHCKFSPEAFDRISSDNMNAIENLFSCNAMKKDELKAFSEGTNREASMEATEKISMLWRVHKEKCADGEPEQIATAPLLPKHLPISSQRRNEYSCKSLNEPPNPFTFNENDTWNELSYCSSAPSSASFESFPMTPTNAGVRNPKRNLRHASFPEFIELSPNHVPFRTFGSESFELELDESNSRSDFFSSKCSDWRSQIPAELYMPSFDMDL